MIDERTLLASEKEEGECTCHRGLKSELKSVDLGGESNEIDRACTYYPRQVLDIHRDDSIIEEDVCTSGTEEENEECLDDLNEEDHYSNADQDNDFITNARSQLSDRKKNKRSSDIEGGDKIEEKTDATSESIIPEIEDTDAFIEDLKWKTLPSKVELIAERDQLKRRMADLIANREQLIVRKNELRQLEIERDLDLVKKSKMKISFKSIFGDNKGDGDDVVTSDNDGDEYDCEWVNLNEPKTDKLIRPRLSSCFDNNHDDPDNVDDIIDGDGNVDGNGNGDISKANEINVQENKCVKDITDIVESTSETVWDSTSDSTSVSVTDDNKNCDVNSNTNSVSDSNVNDYGDSNGDKYNDIDIDQNKAHNTLKSLNPNNNNKNTGRSLRSLGLVYECGQRAIGVARAGYHALFKVQLDLSKAVSKSHSKSIRTSIRNKLHDSSTYPTSRPIPIPSNVETTTFVLSTPYQSVSFAVHYITTSDRLFSTTQYHPQTYIHSSLFRNQNPPNTHTQKSKNSSSSRKNRDATKAADKPPNKSKTPKKTPYRNSQFSDNTENIEATETAAVIDIVDTVKPDSKKISAEKKKANKKERLELQLQHELQVERELKEFNSAPPYFLMGGNKFTSVEVQTTLAPGVLLESWRNLAAQITQEKMDNAARRGSKGVKGGKGGKDSRRRKGGKGERKGERGSIDGGEYVVGDEIVLGGGMSRHDIKRIVMEEESAVNSGSEVRVAVSSKKYSVHVNNALPSYTPTAMPSFPLSSRLSSTSYSSRTDKSNYDSDDDDDDEEELERERRRELDAKSKVHDPGLSWTTTITPLSLCNIFDKKNTEKSLKKPYPSALLPMLSFFHPYSNVSQESDLIDPRTGHGYNEIVDAVLPDSFPVKNYYEALAFNNNYLLFACKKRLLQQMPLTATLRKNGKNELLSLIRAFTNYLFIGETSKAHIVLEQLKVKWSEVRTIIMMITIMISIQAFIFFTYLSIFTYTLVN